MVYKNKFFWRSSVKYQTFSEGREVIYFPYVARKNEKPPLIVQIL